MCGIFGLIQYANTISTTNLAQATRIIQHRGPDDEGFLLWNPEQGATLFAGNDTSTESHQKYELEMLPETNTWNVAMGHRRLSILDLSPAGHQPMQYPKAGLSISFNGEVYNYIEIREELKGKGHQFMTQTDTEVVLHAWAEWGANALSRFNGMFAFLLLDEKRRLLYAVRDRFGVKPLYYTQTPQYLAFASEVKQLRVLPDYHFDLNEQIAFDYLLNGQVDHVPDTFEKGIQQVSPGHFIRVDLKSHRWEDLTWYTLAPKPWKGTEEEAFQQFVELLMDSVRLRMRADVPVGSALSGGLDSSTIVCLMREVLDAQGHPDHVFKTITSCHKDKKYDEWEYAEEVIKRVNAESYQVFPSFEKLQEDLDRFLWHMDYPFGSTSQFSQWCVFEGAKKAGLTVMIDGQGADEQLAGYGGNDLGLYRGLFRKGKWLAFLKEAFTYKKSHGHYPWAPVLGAIQLSLPEFFREHLPEKVKLKQSGIPDWLIKPNEYESNPGWPNSLGASLQNQVTSMPLPSLLRYEDRNSMAFSIESRVPFMDYRLIEFTLGLPEKFIYKRGVKKHILREAFRGRVPNKVLKRKDKMGFVSAESVWFKQQNDWFLKNIEEGGALSPTIDLIKLKTYLNQVSNKRVEYDFKIWRIVNLNLWLKEFN